MPPEPDASPTAEHLIDASGESLAILERVLAGITECTETRDYVRARLLLLEAVQVPVLNEEMIELLEQVVEEDSQLQRVLWRRGALLGLAEHAALSGIWHEVAGQKVQALGWYEAAQALGGDASDELAALTGVSRAPAPSGDGTCVSCKRPTGLPVQLRHCDDCAITNAIWRPDVWAVTRAAQHLGLKQNVDIVVAKDGWELGEADRRVFRNGTYCGVRRIVDGEPELTDSISAAELAMDVRHCIIVSARLTPEHATRVIWHELAHARAFEREPLTWAASYAVENARIAVKYRESDATEAQRHHLNKFEIEAIAAEREADRFEPLALANRRASLPRNEQHQEIAQVVKGRIIPGPYATQLQERREQRRREAELRERGVLTEPDPRHVRRDDRVAPRTTVRSAAPARPAAPASEPWSGWLGCLLAVVAVYAVLTLLCLKLGAEPGAPIVTDVLAGGIVMGAAAHYGANWAGALALSAVMAIPWFIATVVVNAAMLSPYAPY